MGISPVGRSHDHVVEAVSVHIACAGGRPAKGGTFVVTGGEPGFHAEVRDTLVDRRVSRGTTGQGSEEGRNPHLPPNREERSPSTV